MPKLQQKTLQNDIFHAEKSLAALAREYGKESTQYRNHLTKLGRLWAVLILTRRKDEFYQSLIR